MKIKLLTVLLAASFFTFAAIESVNDSSGKNGYVGSPGEKTCNTSGCHDDNGLNNGPGGMAITTSNMTNWQYTPGQTYHFSVNISEGNKTIFGFGFEALDSANNSVGTIIVTKSTKTTLNNTSNSGTTYPAGRINISHIKGAGAITNSYTYVFDWKAPVSYCGNIRFFATGAACDKDGTAAGDNIYSTSETATPAATAYINQTSNLVPFVGLVSEHSAPQAIYVSGEYMDSDILVSAPSGYEVSLASGTGYDTAITLQATSKSLRLTPVYIRLSPTTTGSINGNITISSYGASSVSVALKGDAYNETSPILYQVGNLVNFGINVGSSSASQTITINAKNLGSDATVSVSAPFKISTSQGGSYSTSITVSPSAGKISNNTIYIKYYPTAVGTQTTNLTVTSNNANTITVPLSGTASAGNSPTMYVQANFAPFFTNKINTPSDAQWFQIDATAISSSSIIVAPTHFEISTQQSSGYSSSLTIAPTSNTISAQKIYIRYNPQFETTEFETFNIANPSLPNKFLSVVGYVAKAQGKLKVTINGTDTICSGDQVTLEASGAASYNWQPSNSSANYITVTPSRTTNYTLTGTTGSQTSTAQFTVVVMSPPIAGFTYQANDSDVAFTNTSTFASSNQWNFGDGKTSTSSNPKHVYSAAGTYTVVLLATGKCGVDRISQDVTISLAPTNVYITGNTNICNGDSTTLTAAGAASYMWQPGNITTSIITVKPTQTTTYSVVGTSGSQTGNAQTTINIIPATDASFTTQANKSDVTLSNTSKFGASYSWDFGDGQTSTLTNPIHTYKSAGTYKIMMNAKGTCNTDTASQYVTIEKTVVNNGIANTTLNNISLYPNPATSHIYIDHLDGKATVKLYSIDGLLILSTNINSSDSGPASLSLPNLENGIYIIQIINATGENYQQKILIEN